MDRNNRMSRARVQRYLLTSVLLTASFLFASVLSARKPHYRDNGSVVRIDEENRLIVNGVPFFPMGFFGPGGDEGMARIAAAGYNTILCYGYGLHAGIEGARDFLDRAQKHGLWVLYSLKDYYPKYYEKKWPSLNLAAKGLSNAELARTRHVEPLKDHPALLAWYIADEHVPANSGRQPHGRDYMLALQEMVHEVDPNHPTMAVTNTKWSKPPQYIGAADIVTADPYPIPGQPLKTVSDYLDELRDGVTSNMPVWHCVQVFDKGVYGGIGDTREPTFSEIRCMTYLGLTRAVNGVIYYHYNDLMRRAGRQNENELNFQRRWAQMQCIAPELEKAARLLLHGDTVPLDIRPTGETDAEDLEQLSSRALRHDGQLYLMLANAGEKVVQCEIDLPGGDWTVAGYLQGAALSGEIDGEKLAVVLSSRNADTLILTPGVTGEE